MTNNPLLFPSKFAEAVRYGNTNLSLTTAASSFQVKQLLLRMFYGSSNPAEDISTFYFESDRFRWTSGHALLDESLVAISAGENIFNGSADGKYYIYAQDDGSIHVSAIAPTLATQQIWWTLYVENDLIVDILPGKPGFGV